MNCFWEKLCISTSYVCTMLLLLVLVLSASDIKWGIYRLLPFLRIVFSINHYLTQRLRTTPFALYRVYPSCTPYCSLDVESEEQNPSRLVMKLFALLRLFLLLLGAVLRVGKSSLDKERQTVSCILYGDGFSGGRYHSNALYKSMLIFLAVVIKTNV